MTEAVVYPLNRPLSSLEATSPIVESAKYRPDIDGLRAVAALLVVAVHTNLLPGGFIGVDIFFVISGYLISGIILRQLYADRFSFLDFYARRVRRIFPALIVVLLAVVAWGWLVLLSDEYQLLGKDVAVGAAFLMNFTEWLRRDAHVDLPRMLGHLWSLGVEEQFYLFWPVLLYAMWHWARSSLVSVALGRLSDQPLDRSSASTNAHYRELYRSDNGGLAHRSE